MKKLLAMILAISMMAALLIGCGSSSSTETSTESTSAKEDYGESVKTIAEHFDLPYVDFRGDSKVTKCSGSHPNAAGMAHMAVRIYEETKEQVEEIKSKL